MEAIESENIWLRYLEPYKQHMKQPFVKTIEIDSFNSPFITPRLLTMFSFRTNLIDYYEKYPESVMSGLSKIGGILALVRIV